jgi:alkylation response protein AidB-like acyl-CoA dehydrogenase
MRLTEEHAQIRAQTRRFADEVIRPVAAELDRTERFPAEMYGEMARLGLFGISVGEADGGAGADCLSYALVMEELARGYASIADQCGLVELVGALLAEHGTAEQKAHYLAPLLRAERRCAYAITEADAGSDVAGIRTTASRTAATRTTEGWRLDGSKLWIHNAPVCDFAVVLARTDPPAGRRGMSIFLVDRDRPGFEAGPKEHKMGQCASQVGALRFDGVHLPEDARLEPENRGFHMMMSVLDKGRVGIAALAVGILQAALEAALDHARTRRQFGQTIAGFQGVQWMLADMAKDLAAARLLAHDAAAPGRRSGSPPPAPAAR